MFKIAIEQFVKSKTVKVFAPVGVWAIDEEKDKWIDALCKKPKKAEFIAGLPPSKEYENVAYGRLNKLRDAGVKVWVSNPVEIFTLGLIIFDTEVVIGGTCATPDKLDYSIVSRPIVRKLCLEVFESAKNVSEKYG